MPQRHLFLNFEPQSPPLTIGTASNNATDKYFQPNIFGCLSLGFRTLNSLFYLAGVNSAVENVFLCLLWDAWDVHSTLAGNLETKHNKFNLMVQNNGMEFGKENKICRILLSVFPSRLDNAIIWMILTFSQKMGKGIEKKSNNPRKSNIHKVELGIQGEQESDMFAICRKFASLCAHGPGPVK